MFGFGGRFGEPDFSFGEDVIDIREPDEDDLGGGGNGRPPLLVPLFSGVSISPSNMTLSGQVLPSHDSNCSYRRSNKSVGRDGTTAYTFCIRWSNFWMDQCRDSFVHDKYIDDLKFC